MWCCSAAQARLHSSGGWAPAPQPGHWLQVALNNATKITAMATQGHIERWWWTKQYLLYSSCDDKYWQPYKKVILVEHFPALTCFAGFPSYSQHSKHQKLRVLDQYDLRPRNARTSRQGFVAMISGAHIDHKLVSGNMLCYKHSEHNKLSWHGLNWRKECTEVKSITLLFLPYNYIARGSGCTTRKADCGPLRRVASFVLVDQFSNIPLQRRTTLNSPFSSCTGAAW